MTGQQRASIAKRSLLVALFAMGLVVLGVWLALRSPMLGRAMADALLRDQGQEWRLRSMSPFLRPPRPPVALLARCSWARASGGLFAPREAGLNRRHPASGLQGVGRRAAAELRGEENARAPGPPSNVARPPGSRVATGSIPLVYLLMKDSWDGRAPRPRELEFRRTVAASRTVDDDDDKEDDPMSTAVPTSPRHEAPPERGPISHRADPRRVLAWAGPIAEHRRALLSMNLPYWGVALLAALYGLAKPELQRALNNRGRGRSVRRGDAWRLAVVVAGVTTPGGRPRAWRAGLRLQACVYAAVALLAVAAVVEALEFIYLVPLFVPQG